MKIGFASRLNPLDKRSWSGTTYYTYQQINKNCEVEIFNFKWTWQVREWLTMQKSLNRKLFKKNTAVEFLRSYAKYFSRQLQKELKKKPVDVLFVSASSQFIAYLETDIPVIYMTDATFQQLQGYYPYFSNLAKYNVQQGIELDKKAFLKTAHCMLASEWNKNSAINDYGIDTNKISVVPCGANLDKIPAATELNMDASGQCRLLFLGVEWARKGGDIALETFRLLKQKGANPYLHVIGCVPPFDITTEKNITVIPFLDKNNPGDFDQLHQILLQTDFLLLPTRAECAGVVFSEASAYGIPSITTDTGGVTTYVKNGVNGFALPVQAGADVYAEKIGQLYADKQAMQNLKLSSRKYYEENLNWDSWGLQFWQIAERLVKEKR
ncbi:MAG TPA: glycosyltransferase family 4 protein [Chitinophagaceae bacterium]|nr:glycosyltransferase family 4 protein [Chitinophagaceae bacterium]